MHWYYVSSFKKIFLKWEKKKIWGENCILDLISGLLCRPTDYLFLTTVFVTSC